MNKNLKKFLSLILMGALSLSMGISSFGAQTKEGAENRIQQLEQEKAALESKLSGLKENKTDTEAYITELDAQMTDISAQIQELNTQIEDITVQIEETQKDLDEAKAKEEQQYAVLKLRIKAMYEQGETSYVEMLLGAKDISTLLNSSEYISQVSDFDNRLLASLEQTRIDIKNYEEELTAQKTEMETVMVELEGKQDEINTLTEAKKEELQSINGDIDSAEGDLSDIEEDLANENKILSSINAAAAAAQAEYERLKASMSTTTVDQNAQKAAEEAERLAREQAAIAEQAKKDAEAAQIAAEEKADEEARAAAAAAQAKAEADAAAAEQAKKDAEAAREEANKAASSGGSLAVGSGSFTWPLPGYTTISSNFGTRICPFHGPENHNGIDVPAPGGTPVLAADAGVVTRAAYDSSLGNYVVINHGNGYSTWYLHNSGIAVSVGQSVARGQVISYVGTTGSSTGNHLDFRVMTDGGAYVNPLSVCTPY